MNTAAAAILAALVLSATARADTPRVVSAAPEGELDALEHANEIRVVFSEPMVALGRIPQPVRAPFVQVEPALPGSFRWSGTTILVFTPDPKRPLPYATRYEVTPFSGLAVHVTVTLPFGWRCAARPLSRDGLDAISMIVAIVVLLVSATCS